MMLIGKSEALCTVTKLMRSTAIVSLAGFGWLQPAWAAQDDREAVGVSYSEETKNEVASTTEGQDIVVTGIRASLERGVEAKRRSIEIVDAISAEDLGKLPDQNIAEGLQRITGVQIQRSGGEGNRFQIRGSDQNLTLVNGIEVAPDGDLGQASPVPTRQINLFNYPSDLFTEILVYKSPSASLIEGGIGGTVDLRMPDPLTTASRTLASGRLAYFGLRETLGVEATMLTSQRLADDRIGILVAASYFKRNTITDAFGGSSYFETNAVDVTGDGIGDSRLALPFNMTYIRNFNDRARFTANGLVTWEASDTLKARLEATYIHQVTDFNRGFIGFNLSNARAIPGIVPSVETAADGSTTFLSGELQNILLTQDGLAQDESRDIYQGAFSLAWNPSDDLEIKGLIAASKSDVQSLLTVYQARQTGIRAAIDLTSAVPGASPTSGGPITDINAFQAFVSSVRLNKTSPELYQGRLDTTYKFDSLFLSKLMVGGRITRQTFDNVTLQNRFQNTFPIGTNFPLNRFPEYVSNFAPDNFFDGANGEYPTNWIIPVIRPNLSDATEFLRTIGDDRPLQPQAVSNYQITERTYASYAQLDWDTLLAGMELSGNIGVRYVKTKLISESSAAIGGGTIVPVEVRNEYDDWLPSINVRLGISEKVVARLAASKVMSRPPIQNLSAGTTITFSSGLSQASSGQPLLEPFRADQVSASLEYYSGSGGIISAALFYQDIGSYVTTAVTPGASLPSFPGQTFFLSQPVNGPGGTAKGAEFGIQQSLEFLSEGLRYFGGIVNYTYVDSKREGSDLPIERTSKHSYNVIGYFERGPFQARLAYNWRSEQYLGFVRASDVFLSSRGQLDAAISLDLSDTVNLSLEGIDILQSPQRGYATFDSRPNLYDVNDRRIFVGVRARF